MPAVVAIPQHKLTDSPNSRSIGIFDWFITASINPIPNVTVPECDDAIQSLFGIPLPEMTFGNNYLKLEHRPSGVKYSFTAQESLQNVKKGELVDGDSSVEVGYADKWLETRQEVSRML